MILNDSLELDFCRGIKTNANALIRFRRAVLLNTCWHFSFTGTQRANV